MVVAILVKPVHGTTLLAVLALIGFCALQLLNVVTGKLVITEDALVTRVWFRSRSIQLKNISSVTEERWDGGWIVVKVWLLGVTVLSPV